MKQTVSNSESTTSLANVSTLSIDIGGTSLKASVLDRAGKILVDPVSMATPYPCSPRILLKALAGLVAPLPPFERISVGFPGVIRDGRTLTAPHFGARHGAIFHLPRPCPSVSANQFVYSTTPRSKASAS